MLSSEVYFLLVLNEEDPKNADDPNNKDNSKNEDNLKNEDDPKNEDDHQEGRQPQKWILIIAWLLGIFYQYDWVKSLKHQRWMALDFVLSILYTSAGRKTGYME